MVGNDSNATRPLPDRLLSGALVAARMVAGAAVVMCSLLATADTLGLWLFNRPVDSVVEISQVLLIAIMFFGLGTAERAGDHITVSLVRDQLPPRVRRLADIASRTVSILVYLVIAAAGWMAAARSVRTNEYSDGLVSFPLYPFRYVLVIGAVLAILAAVAVAISGSSPAKSPEPDGD